MGEQITRRRRLRRPSLRVTIEKLEEPRQGTTRRAVIRRPPLIPAIRQTETEPTMTTLLTAPTITPNGTGIITLIRRGPIAITGDQEGPAYDPALAVARLAARAIRLEEAIDRLPPGHGLSALLKWSQTDGTEYAVFAAHDPETCFTTELPGDYDTAIIPAYQGPIADHCRRCGTPLF